MTRHIKKHINKHAQPFPYFSESLQRNVLINTSIINWIISGLNSKIIDIKNSILIFNREIGSERNDLYNELLAKSEEELKALIPEELKNKGNKR